MADLIDRGDFRQAFECVFRGKLDGMSAQDVTHRMRKLLKELPGVDAAPVVHARWIGGELGTCSACGHYGCASDIWDGVEGSGYCPNCGAKMDGESDG